MQPGLEIERCEPVVALDLARSRAREYAAIAKAPSTIRAYAADWRDFVSWCEGCGVAFLPASSESVAFYLAARACSLRPQTLTRRLTAITKFHARAGWPSPAKLDHAAVSETLKGIRREHGIAEVRKLALVTADVQELTGRVDSSLAGLRDRALLLVWYCAGFRRSEVVRLCRGDMAWEREGIAARVRRSKTDQFGEGRKVALPRGAHRATCPVLALEAWLARADEADAEAGRVPGDPALAVFRAIDRHGNLSADGMHPNSAGEIVKRSLARSGYEPAPYGGHSLRAGFVTQAYRNGAKTHDIMRQTGHKSAAMVERYIRDAGLFMETSAGKLGL